MLVILHQFGALSHCISGLVPSWISFGVSHGISVTKLADSGKKPKGLVNKQIGKVGFASKLRGRESSAQTDTSCQWGGAG